MVMNVHVHQLKILKSIFNSATEQVPLQMKIPKPSFILQPKIFLKPSKTADRCNLVFRQLVNSADPDVVLGTAFLKGVYTWFVDPVEGDNDDGTKKSKWLPHLKYRSKTLNLM